MSFCQVYLCLLLSVSPDSPDRRKFPALLQTTRWLQHWVYGGKWRTTLHHTCTHSPLLHCTTTHPNTFTCAAPHCTPPVHAHFYCQSAIICCFLPLLGERTIDLSIMFQAWRKYDTDRSGYIEANELKVRMLEGQGDWPGTPNYWVL